MREDIIGRSKILIVDDQQANVRYLERILAKHGGTQLASTTDSREVMSLYHEFQPDLIILDLMMPYLDGFQVMSMLKPILDESTYLPILVLTADITPEAKRRALEIGAMDFLTKPFDATEALLRIGNLLQTRMLHLQLHNQNRTLEQKVAERTHELEESQLEVLERLALAAEYRDDDTGQHTHRVGQLAGRLARHLGLEEDMITLISRAAPLHDVGKIGIPDDILLKPGKLTPSEFEVMKSHTIIGARILSRGRSELIRTAQMIAMTHHENWNGTGYPHAISSTKIPIAGRIVAAVDVFDALTHQRPYKQAWSFEEASAEMLRQSGIKFDPAVVDAMMLVLAEGIEEESTPHHFAPEPLSLYTFEPSILSNDPSLDTWLSEMKETMVTVTYRQQQGV